MLQIVLMVLMKKANANLLFLNLLLLHRQQLPSYQLVPYQLPFQLLFLAQVKGKVECLSKVSQMVVRIASEEL